MRQLDMVKAGSGNRLRRNEGLNKEQALIKRRLRQGEGWCREQNETGGKIVQGG